MPEWSDKCLSVEITLFFFLKKRRYYFQWVGSNGKIWKLESKPQWWILSLEEQS